MVQAYRVRALTLRYLFMLDIHTARTLYRGRISTDTVFVSTPHAATGGVLGVTMKKVSGCVAKNQPMVYIC